MDLIRWSEVAPRVCSSALSIAVCASIWRTGSLTRTARFQSLCPTLGALERLSGQAVERRSSSAPVSFMPMPRTLEELVGRSPFEALATIRRMRALLCRSALQKAISTAARDTVGTAPSARCACPCAALSTQVSAQGFRQPPSLSCISWHAHRACGPLPERWSVVIWQKPQLSVYVPQSHHACVRFCRTRLTQLPRQQACSVAMLTRSGLADGAGSVYLAAWALAWAPAQDPAQQTGAWRLGTMRQPPPSEEPQRLHGGTR